jgi:DNA repair exonuclease SbcCD ATPase subunit
MKNIEDLQEKIEEAKKKQSNLQGRMEEAENRLKEIYGMSLEFAKNWLIEEEKSLEKREEEIRKKFAELQENYPW